MGVQRHGLFDRGPPVQREPDPYVPGSKRPGVEDAGRDRYRLAAAEVRLLGHDILDGQVRRQGATDVDQLDVNGLRKAVGERRAEAAALEVGEEEDLLAATAATRPRHRAPRRAPWCSRCRPGRGGFPNRAVRSGRGRPAPRRTHARRTAEPSGRPPISSAACRRALSSGEAPAAPARHARRPVDQDHDLALAPGQLGGPGGTAARTGGQAGARRRHAGPAGPSAECGGDGPGRGAPPAGSGASRSRPAAPDAGTAGGSRSARPPPPRPPGTPDG